MNTENMKLLDLQTGKYLDIGRDWGYYGTKISLKQKQQEAILGHLQFDRQSMKELSKPNEYSMQYQLSLTAMEVTDDVLLKIADVLIEQGTIGIQPHTDPIINILAGKAGAVIYGGRYVLFKQKSFNYKQYSNIFEEYSKQLRNEPNKFEGLYHLISLAKKIDELNKNQEYNGFSLKQKISTALNLDF